MEMFRTLVKTEAVAVGDRSLLVRYFELRTIRGARRYSAEILLAPGDRIILDDDSVVNLEARTNVLGPATLHSRSLATKPAAACWFGVCLKIPHDRGAATNSRRRAAPNQESPRSCVGGKPA